MRKRFIYDIETDGLLKELSRIHSLVMWDLDAGELLSFRNDGHPDNLARLEDGLRMLNDATFRAGHNIIKFDEPAIAKLYPWFKANREGVVFDTLIATRLIWPNIGDSDGMRVKRKKLPGKLTGSHTLEAWGCRLGFWKGDYAKIKAEELIAQDPDAPKEEIIRRVWATWSQEMQDYCDQDVRVSLKLYQSICKKNYAARAFDDEMAIAILCQKIEHNGFPFDERKAGILYGSLVGERDRIGEELKRFFGSWIETAGNEKTPTVSNASQGYWGETQWFFLDGDELGPEDFTKGGLPNAAAKSKGVRREFTGYPYQPIKIIEFSPTSRHHIAKRLKTLYGWEPQIFTPDGSPKVDEDVLKTLDFEPIPLLVKYFTVAKRIGQLAEGKQAWLKKLDEDGRIHGKYNTVGAVTRRATHSDPNIGQVPGATFNKQHEVVYGEEAGWGSECRELFGAPKGWYQVGTDASGLELRCLAHFMARWDDGEYARILLTGDIHTANQNAAGLPERNDAKTFISKG